MDLSDGSDVEAEIDLDQNVEDALLGSDDEELGIQYSRSKYINSHEYLEDEEGHVHGEDGDVLDLELNDDDGLEFEDDLAAHPHRGGNRVAPVQVRASAISTQDYSAPMSTAYHHNEEEEYHDEGHDDRLADIEDEDDEDDDRNTRSRFQSERNPGSLSERSSSSGNSFGNPIQTVGGPGQKNWNNSQGPGLVQRQRFPQNRQALLDNPRQGFNQMNRPRGFGPRFGPNGPQLQGRMFTDFNSPMMRPHHGPRNGGPPMMQGQGPPRPMHGPPRHQNPRFQNRNPNARMRMRGPGPGPGPHPHPGQQGPPNQQWRQQRPPFPHGMPMNQRPQHPFPPNNPHLRPQNMFQDHEFLEPGHGPRPEMNIPGPFQPQNNSMHPHPGPPHGQFPVNSMGHQQNRMQPQQPQPFTNHEMQAPNFPPQNPFYPPTQGPQPQQMLQPTFANDQSHQRLPPPPRPQPQAFWPNQQQPPEPHMNPNWIRPNSQSQHPGFIQPAINPAFTQPNMTPPVMCHPSVESYPQERQKSAEEASYEESVRNFLNQQQRPHHRDNQRSASYENSSHSRSPSHSYRESEYEYDAKQERYPSKRKYDEPHPRISGSPEKAQRLNGRLGPHPGTAAPKDEKTEQLQKIRDETTRSMGLDADYIKKLEEQKKLREEILRKKAEARRKLVDPAVDSSEPLPPSRNDSDTPSRIIGKLNSAARPSIYINPRAFRGDLSALNLQKININSNDKITKTIRTNAAPSGKTTSLKPTQPPTTAEKFLKKPGVKGKTILRIVKDKHGNVISRSKVFVVPKLQQDETT